MTAASEQLRALARRIATANLAHTQPAAVLLTGSAAVGTADAYSDIVLIVYYDDALPDDAALQRARSEIGATDFRWLIPRTEHGMAEGYRLDGVECQVAHGAVVDWERTIDDVRSRRAIAHAEALVRETLELLARHLPDVDIPSLGHQPGERHQPWR